MKELIKAIVSKTAGSALYSDVSGRIFIYPAPAGAEYPYVVFDIISSSPDDGFSVEIENTLAQFSIYSDNSSAVEIADIYSDLKSLFKDCRLTITGDTHIAFEQVNFETINEEITTPAGDFMLRHWAVDYSVIVQD